MTIYRLCPAWKRHVKILWDLKVIRIHWYCKHCPLTRLNGTGRAYRRTIGEED